MKETKLFPGSIMIRKESCLVIGEIDHGICVMVHDSAKKLGGLCHFVFPDHDHGEKGMGDSFFGDTAILNLLKRLKTLGATPDTLTVNVIGGSESSASSAELARKNIAKFKDVFARFKLKLDKSALGGSTPRMVRFNPGTGEVAFKVLAQKPAASANAVVASQPSVSSPSAAPGAKCIWVLAADKAQQQRYSDIICSDSMLTVGHQDASISEASIILNRDNPPLGILYVHGENDDDDTLLKFINRQELPMAIVRPESKEGLDAKLKERDTALEIIGFPKSGNLAEITVLIKSKLRTLTNAITVQNGKVVQDRGNGLDINTVGILAIGSSTGGPQALEVVLSNLPAKIPPIVISQHIPPVYSTSLAERLNGMCPFTVKEPVDNEEIVPGTCYFSPGGFQFRIKKTGPRITALVKKEPPVNKHIPSVDVLFYSVAKYFGSDAMGVMLTGMGKDGAEGMLEMKRQGSFNIAQDEKSSVVFGMPKEAIDLGAVHKVYGLNAIPNKIIEHLKKRGRSAA